MVDIYLDGTSLEKTIQENDVVFMDFFADWCGPCKLASPGIDKIAKEYKTKALVLKIDTEQHQDIAKKYGVMSIPTVIIMEKGVEVARKVGFPGEQVYRNMLDNVINKG